MRGQGWREGQPLGARDHQGAIRVTPLDATADLRGRPPAVRTGLGFVRASATPGDPTPPHHSPGRSPDSPSPSSAPHPSPPIAPPDPHPAPPPSAVSEEDTDMPPAPPAVATDPRPPVDEYMELEAQAAELPAGDPLVEACALWLEEEYPRQSQEARRMLIAALHTACPTVWRTHRAGRGPPGTRVQEELHALAQRKGWHAGSSSEDEPSDDAFAGGPSGRRRRGGRDLATGPSGRQRRGGRALDAANGPSGRRQGVRTAQETPPQPRWLHGPSNGPLAHGDAAPQAGSSALAGHPVPQASPWFRRLLPP